MQTSEETLKALSEAVDAYASAKMANNETLIRYSIANLQEFLNGHVITPATAEAGAAGEEG
jgi:uncharacterized Fe-S radical SAM superfamily protein PflX